MSHNIPLEIQEEILKRLPVKSLIQFRSVSKARKSLIDSTDFIKHYISQQQHLLVRYNVRDRDLRDKYLLVADDDSFPHQKVSLTIPLSFNNYCMIGSSHGLLCFYSHWYSNGKGMAFLFNHSIQKSVSVVVPLVVPNCATYIGFGVCRETIDPKIVKITNTDPQRIVEVFTLSARAWRRPYGTNVPRKSIIFIYSQVFIDGIIYWLGIDRITTDGVFRSRNLIISFDMTSEEFREVNLPRSLERDSILDLSIAKLRGSLVVLEKYTLDVWKMEAGVSKSFTKLFTVGVNVPRACLMGFRKNGVAIINLEKRFRAQKLIAFEPCTKRMDDVGVGGNGMSFPFCVHPYMETLLLLDQPNLL